MASSSTSSSGSQSYSLIFTNNSSNAWNACVYQTDPDISNYQVQSLAWLTKAAAPTTTVSFTWTIDYSFVWDETGVLVPGVVFDASQVWPANLTTTNAVTLTHKVNPTSEYYTFANQTQGPNQGSLYIYTDDSVPLNLASCGIGMSGYGTFVVQAQPNLNLIFTPHPTYWITFGTFVQGEVLDETEITNAAKVEFTPGVFTMYANLAIDNTWQVSSSPIT